MFGDYVTKMYPNDSFLEENNFLVNIPHTWQYFPKNKNGFLCRIRRIIGCWPDLCINHLTLSQNKLKISPTLIRDSGEEKKANYGKRKNTRKKKEKENR
jgi:hypothetical protein